jgi:hypothetical protein
MRKVGIVLPLVLAGCSSNKLNNKTAANVIRSPLAQDQNTIVTEIGRVGAKCVYTMDDGKEHPADLSPEESSERFAAEAVGYLSVTPDGPGFWKVALTEKGKAVVLGKPAPQPPLKGCDYQQVSFLLATPELVEVTGVTADENAPEVEYLWKWNITDFGRELRKDGKAFAALDQHQRTMLARFVLSRIHKLPIPVPPEGYTEKGTVQLKRYADGWRPK